MCKAGGLAYIYIYIYICVCVSLYGPGAPKAPTGQGAGANSGAQKPPGTAGVAQPQCLGEAGRPAREEPPQTTELRPGSAAGARNDHEQSFN